MATAEERLMEWLRDAHAMEEHAITMLTALAGRIENYPEVQAQVEEHLEETRRHESDIRACIERRGGGTSLIKDLAGKAIAAGQGLGGMFASDEIVKGSMASYAFEHIEIAAYTVLVSTAEAVADMETREVCRRILEEERAMAHRLEIALPFITRKYLNREETPGETAKR